MTGECADACWVAAGGPMDDSGVAMGSEGRSVLAKQEGGC